MKLSSKNLTKYIDSYPTKYPEGFLSSETNSILTLHNIDADEFYKILGVNTCMVKDNQILNYHCDIELALRCIIEKRDKTSIEWD
jgi:hypothetical protein